MITPTRYVNIATILLCIVLAASRSSWGATGDSVRQGVILQARFVLGPDQCPKAVQVWLVSTPDTVQGLEVFLTWDRPDFALFALKKVRRTKGGSGKSMNRLKDSPNVADSAVLQPAIERGQGLLKQWEFVEARGETGLWVKVTSAAYLISNARPRPICPGESGLLFSLPLTLAKSQMPFAEGDSAVVRLDNLLTRGSDANGNMLENLVLRDAVTHVAPCRHTAKRPR